MNKSRTANRMIDFDSAAYTKEELKNAETMNKKRMMLIETKNKINPDAEKPLEKTAKNNEK